MVWGFMSAGCVGQLTICEGTMISPKYCQILEHHMLPSTCALFNCLRAHHWIFQWENAPCHTARASKTWMNEHGVQLLDSHAQSLDMRPIENLWCIIKATFSERKPRNMQELRSLVVDELNNITPEQCKRLVENMLKRIQTLVRACGLGLLSFYTCFLLYCYLCFGGSGQKPSRSKAPRTKALIYTWIICYFRRNIWVIFLIVASKRYI